ncbi:hypothetical protein I8J29_21405 [Paenibacillus sp. MWE-103]|uniref:Uncharacterized protein n=1 Tax=Paenibacillus artemisiicola TaxID=1172618 RepID=A0ABS3WEM1_9BACL|nr:hypothetical protein [Paenibacillus artemisiicola]MBO7746776.1 hypothetical protein [Paenibacillus artemisiicola]
MISAFSLTWNHQKYKVTGESVKEIKENLGTSDGSTARDVYRISGKEPSAEIAIEQLDHSFFKAIAVSR